MSGLKFIQKIPVYIKYSRKSMSSPFSVYYPNTIEYKHNVDLTEENVMRLLFLCANFAI